ncbi:MAG: DUF3754 domain-containing protein [Planctomycetota bacterium]
MDKPEDNLVGRIEDDPIAQKLTSRATYIPYRDPSLRQKLTEYLEIPETDRDQFRFICQGIQSLFHVEHLALLQRLEEVYDSLDPDSQYIDLDSDDREHQDSIASELFQKLTQMLYSAHYKRLSRTDIEKAVAVGSQWGAQIDVDFSIFDRLEIFARGYRKVTRHRRRWQNLFRKETIEIPEFQRLIIFFRVKDHESKKQNARDDSDANLLDHQFVYIKAFKNIPETDLEMLLPGTTVRLTKLDHAKILFPTLSGLAITIYKIFRGVLVLSIAITLHQRLNQLIGWLFFLGISSTYVVKSVLSYFRTKNKYQFDLTKSLYLKNLDNNLATIYRILIEAEEQEYCEAVLAYAVLRYHPELSDQGTNEQHLDDLVEEFLNRSTSIDVDFEVCDALEKLRRLRLARQSDSTGNWIVVKEENASQRLVERWGFGWGQH